MSGNVKLKDWFYYDDLIYKIKSLAGIEQKEDKIIEDRIWKREEMTEEIVENGLVVYTLSSFQEEVFEIVRGISKKVNVPFRNLYEIAKYSELVEEVLIEIEKKKNLNVMFLEKRFLSYINTNLDKNMGYEVLSEFLERKNKERFDVTTTDVDSEVGSVEKGQTSKLTRKLLRL